ncbi:hypothetical protein Salat_1888000 [Sesamum alatum]|uniref:MBD domain-containing protein n=1 Tax=Sesamum alatum TaxID=300844 RepID=A0AAE1Y3J3_9LAMI|nr:hypothetical protein Salat_1888000 [Sesamum alatum]
MATPEPFIIPDGWKLVTKVDSKGTSVQYYTNVLGQRFYSKEDLLRNIKDAKQRGLSIYDPEFNASSLEASNSRGKKKKRKGVKSSMKQKQVKKEPEIQGGRSAFHIRDQTIGTDKCRTSRRLAGLEPELKCEFKLDKALEYVIKD